MPSIDAPFDTLTGASGLDWYFANSDSGVLDDLGSILGSEIIDDLD